MVNVPLMKQGEIPETSQIGKQIEGVLDILTIGIYN
jgi:hypothetical protein